MATRIRNDDKDEKDEDNMDNDDEDMATTTSLRQLCRDCSLEK